MDSLKDRAAANPCSGLILPTLLLLVAVLALLFRNGLLPGHTVFSNDGPLGTLSSHSHAVPYTFTGGWQDLNTLGYRESGALPNITYLMLWLLGPVLFSKLYAPVALLILGLGAWCFFRQLRFQPVACVAGALAATLNSGFFSAAAWGVAAHAITIGMNFLALAAVADTSPRLRWVRVAAAGAAVGMGVMEGADIGAIFSLYTAAFMMYQAWRAEGSRPANLVKGAVQVALVAVVAALVAAQTVIVLVATQIQGVAGTQQDLRTKEQRWDWATQWSLPKREALGLIIPGLFGYRMDTPALLPPSLQKAYSGGNYWGAVGRDPAWDRYFASGQQGQPPSGFLRFTGGGNYAGVLVVLVGLWATAQALRKKDSVFPLEQRRWIWFWSAVALISLLLAFGRFAPFYQFLYLLPYFSTIRNPAKFLHIVDYSLVILFAYGLHGLWQRHVVEAVPTQHGLVAAVKSWWRQVRGFDRRWTVVCLGSIGASVLGWLIYSSSREDVVRYLQTVRFDPATAEAIARFSVTQVAWFILTLVLAVALVTVLLSGAFAGPRSRWGAVLVGAFLIGDLGRANLPWIITWDYKQKYASNPIIDRLRQNPHEQRVAILPDWIGQVLQSPPELELIRDLYRIEWAQHHFLFYNIQSLDIVQLPRMPEDLLAFEQALQPKNMAEVPRLVPRRWQLTSTRYLLGPADYLGFLNQQVDAGQQRFRIAERFQIVPKPGIERPMRLDELTAVPATNGPFALFEFTGALPRAKLYTNWQVLTNDQAALERLADPAFDPLTTVLLAASPPGTPTTSTNLSPGTVSFVSYAPKDIVLKAEAGAPSVLLLNDRFEPNWKVYVDGRPEPLLRANFIMRAVYLPPGTHEVAFRFEPPYHGLYVSAAAVLLGVLLSAGLFVASRRQERGSSTPAPKDSSPSQPAAVKPRKL